MIFTTLLLASMLPRPSVQFINPCDGLMPLPAAFTPMTASPALPPANCPCPSWLQPQLHGRGLLLIFVCCKEGSLLIETPFLHAAAPQGCNNLRSWSCVKQRGSGARRGSGWQRHTAGASRGLYMWSSTVSFKLQGRCTGGPMRCREGSPPVAASGPPRSLTRVRCMHGWLAVLAAPLLTERFRRLCRAR